jgi:hypothetical protein
VLHKSCSTFIPFTGFLSYTSPNSLSRSSTNFRCPLGSVEGAEALRRPPPPPDGPMILFDDIIEVLDPP